MFKLRTQFEPKGDQPQAIRELSDGIIQNRKSQVLLGITGSGKTFTMANVIQKVQRPALILAHNKTLAAQLYQEFKAFFPENAVEYFVSYYDYYQPEAYIARTDTYIEKDMAINDQIDRMRLSATRSLLERPDVIIIASVSCIYGLGLPEYFSEMKLSLKVGDIRERDDILLHLVQMHHTRSDYEIARGTFRVRGDVLEVMPAYEEDIAYRIEFFGNDIERISLIDPLTGQVLGRQQELSIYPGSHHVTPDEVRLKALETIPAELESRSAFFQDNNKFIEHQRITERTKYDLEMIKNVGFCKGIENYSRHFSGKAAGEPPACLLDYFPPDFMIFVDESHQTMPQIHAMYNGDQARKRALIDFGFRLPSALDNRPLKFEEFYKKIPQVIYVSATPGAWEVSEAEGIVAQQIIRPTGLLDPIIEVKPATYQVDDALEQIRQNTAQGGKTLVTTLTKKLAEDLTGYLKEIGLKARYLHSDIVTLERVQIINELRKGTIDVLVGINLLREGLDIPEVSLVTILDADKEGFLRSETALIQTCGRAARNAEGRVIMYADKMTKSIEATLRITKERREIQMRYNEEHGITPRSTNRMEAQDLARTFGEVIDELPQEEKPEKGLITPEEIDAKIDFYKKEMKIAAKELRFEDAAKLRDLLHQYEQLQLIE
ncbi:excinuclease ABC subunit UvrB [Rhabdochlamydiaceae symbiont of Dictyostelium giganteum]|uniref:excinuclease ABC subunit UvrB n=1 Tax=Rhabdochlamydiaceae symbiont of Dictyostelium giganteum TaxID=3342349 RepID=UPI00384C419A